MGGCRADRCVECLSRNGAGSSLTRGRRRERVHGRRRERSENETPLEPPFLTVPRYDFTFQFVWTEKLLTERLEQQAADWEQQKQGAPHHLRTRGILPRIREEVPRSWIS